MGEAAHAVHPIAAQGLNLSIRDAAALAEIVVDAHRLGLDIGTPDLLARYQRWRRFDNLGVIAYTDTFFRAFSNRSEEHTSELQSLMRSSYAVFCLKKKKKSISTRMAHNFTKQTKTT